MRRAGSTIALIIAVSACAELPTPAAEGPVPDAPGLRLECISAVVIDGEARVIGLDRAALAGAPIAVTAADGTSLATAIVDEHGRFDAAIGARAGDVVGVSRGDAVWPLRVRDARVSLADLRHPALPGGAGSVPNDLLILPDGRAVLVRSGDDALVVFDVAQGPESGRGVRLPEGDPRAVPWFVVALDARTVAVTSQGRHVVYVVDLDEGVVTAAIEPPAAVALERPFVLPRPLDLDGDGTRETSIGRAPAIAPQGLAVSGGRLVVAYTGFAAGSLPDGSPPVFLPGVIASWPLGAVETSTPTVALAPVLNPQEVHALDDGTVLVTMSGAVSFDAAGRVRTSSGAVWRVDAETLAPVTLWPLGDFGPTTSVIAGDALWVASLARGEVRALPLEGGAPLASLSLNAEAVDSVFRWVELPCGLIGAPSFNTDRIHVVDPRARALDPAPFSGPIVVGPGRPLFDGLQAVARRPGRAGVDFLGPDLFVLAAQASRVTPVELRRILGP